MKPNPHYARPGSVGPFGSTGGSPTKTFKYIRLWIPGKDRSTASMEFESELDFLRAMDRWNSADPGYWQYWRDPDRA